MIKDCIIYADRVTPRVQYIFEFLLGDILGLDISFTQSQEDFSRFEGIQINYSKNDYGKGIFIECNDLLFQEGVTEHIPEVITYQGIPAFYKTSASSTLPFDPFAASFYLISRYEEYYPSETDIHGRFQSKNSIAFRNGFHEKPIVNLWTEMIQNLIVKKYPQAYIKKNKFEFKLTIDVDIAYAHKHKGFLRASAALFKLLTNGQIRSIGARYKTILGLKKDAFDTYDLILSLRNKFAFELYFFFLLGDWSEYDKNLSWKNKGFRQLIKTIKNNAALGIHLSYKSNESFEQMRKEISRLSEITGHEIKRNRQHFLKMSIPQTYQDLVQLGIENDFTMGFSDIPGFRAGTCTPFKFYDLQNEKETNLTIHPFAFMEGNFIDYMKTDPDQALKKIYDLITTTKKMGGVFYSLWHNHTISGIGHWKGWDKVFTDMIEFAYKENE